MIDFLYTHTQALKKKKPSQSHKCCDIVSDLEEFNLITFNLIKQENKVWKISPAETNHSIKGGGGVVSRAQTGLQPLLRWNRPTLKPCVKHIDMSSGSKCFSA